MKNKLFILKSLALAALWCGAAAARADITIYHDQAAFLAAVTAPGTDTFDDLPSESLPTPLLRNAGIHSYLASAGPTSGFYPAGTDSDRWLSTNVASDAITFSDFSAGVYALGGLFFGSDALGSFLPGVTVTLTALSGVSQTVALPNSTSSTFLGFTSSTPLTSVVLSAQPGAYWPTANNLTLAVPEPASYAMLLAGLGLAGLMARRRTR